MKDRVGSIEQRAQSYRVVWRIAGERQTEAFATRSEAEAFRELLAASNGQWPSGWVRGKGFVDASGGRTLGDLVGEWLAYAVKPSNREKVESRWRNMGSGHAIAKTLIADVSDLDARDFANELAGSYAAGTVGLLIGNLRSAYRYAADRGYYSGANPFAGKIKVQSVKADTEAVFLRADEVARLLDALPAKYRLFVRLLLASGLRVGEAYALRVHSANVGKDGRVTLRVDRSANKSGKLGPTKTRKTRYVPLPLALSREIAAHAANRGPSERLFKLPVYESFRDAFNRTVRRAGLLEEHPNGVRIHDLRHTHASDLIMAGVPLLKVSRRLGHSSIRVTADIYGHIHSEDEALLAELDTLA